MNSSVSWELRGRDGVYKTLSKFPHRNRERIIEAIDGLALNPFAGDLEKMKGENRIWRKRVGNYRIFYEIIPADKVIYVFGAERRTSKTY